MDDTTKARVRSFHLTPGRFVIGLLAVEVLLWLSDRFGWLGWHKGYAVLTAVAMVGVAMLGMLLWFAVSLIFRWRFQFSLRSLLIVAIVVAVPSSWCAVERREWLQTLEGKAETAFDTILDGHTLEGLGCGYGGSHVGSFNLAPGECGELIAVARDVVRTGRSTAKPWRPTDCFSMPGTDCIGFRAYSKSKENTDLKYTLWLDLEPYAGMPAGSIGFIRLTVHEDSGKYFYLMSMPLYPAERDCVKDAIERARNHQVGTERQTEKKREPL